MAMVGFNGALEIAGDSLAAIGGRGGNRLPHHDIRQRAEPQRDLWVPSQKGGFLVCLHPQKKTVLVSVASNLSGVMPEPAWEPSQKG